VLVPWKETCAVSERLRFIALVASSGESFSEVCRQFGISRKTGYKWLSRYDLEGPGALEDRPPVAIHIRHKMPKEIVSRIIELRKEHPTWGPRKIRAVIAQHQFWRVPAASSIGAVLKQYGLVSAGQRFRKRSTAVATALKDTTAANDTWCVDFKGHFRMRNGDRCYPLTLSDHQTRYLLKCEALSKAGESQVRPHFERAFRDFGLPERIRSDNGPPFSTRTIGGLSVLAVWWIKLGITPERIEPGHPEQNGRHERMHRTLGADVPPQDDLPAQQLAFDRFRSVYNELRPHEALELRRPAEVYRPSRRSMPPKLEDVEYPSGMLVRRLDRDGSLAFGGVRHITISSVVARELVALKEIENETWILYFGPLALARIEKTKGRPLVFQPLRSGEAEALERAADCKES
jgi:transposase InsO family protein